MLYKETPVVVIPEWQGGIYLKTIDNIKHLKPKRRLRYLKTQFVPRGKHFSSRL
jgi:hypothetical protein